MKKSILNPNPRLKDFFRQIQQRKLQENPGSSNKTTQAPHLQYIHKLAASCHFHITILLYLQRDKPYDKQPLYKAKELREVGGGGVRFR